MEEFIVLIVLELILNFIGASVRWAYGSIWRSIFDKPKFTFSEYLDGPKKSSDFFDDFAHNTNNIVVGIIFLIIVISPIVIIAF